MKEIYLTKEQITRLTKGGSIVFSRGGRKILLAPKEMKAEAQRKRFAEIRVLKERLAALEKGTAVPAAVLTLKNCPKCGKTCKSLGHHMAIVHDGRPSNLPHMKQRIAQGAIHA